MRTILIIIGVIITGLLLPLMVVFLERCLFEDNCSVPWLNYKMAPKSTLTTDSEDSFSQCSKPANFEISYVYRRGNAGQAKAFNNGDVLHSGDSYKLMFKPIGDSFVYIFRINSSHKISRLFPNLPNANPVVQDTQYFVPTEQQSFLLDNTTGKETIYFVVICERDKALEERYTTMTTQNKRSTQERYQARQAWDKAMKKRGPQPKLSTDIASIDTLPLTWSEDNLDHITLPEYLKDLCNGCVHIVEFVHQ